MPNGDEPKKVQRSKGDETVGNTITVALPSLTVLIDEPGGSDDAFELVGDQGYKKTLRLTDAESSVHGILVLRFDGTNYQENYQLIHTRATNDARHFVFVKDGKSLGHHWTKLQNPWVGPIKTPNTYGASVPSKYPTRLPGRYGPDSDVDGVLISDSSPSLLDLEVDDPEY